MSQPTIKADHPVQDQTVASEAPIPTMRLPRVFNMHHRNAPRAAKYCGRGSPAGNPFKIGPDGDRDEVCDKFAAWAVTEPAVMAYIATLAGCDLVCFCAPARCHCDWVLQQANPTLFCATANGTSSHAT